jgi:hypothetical protein
VRMWRWMLEALARRKRREMRTTKEESQEK